MDSYQSPEEIGVKNQNTPSANLIVYNRNVDEKTHLFRCQCCYPQINTPMMDQPAAEKAELYSLIHLSEDILVVSSLGAMMSKTAINIRMQAFV